MKHRLTALLKLSHKNFAQATGKHYASYYTDFFFFSTGGNTHCQSF